MNSGSSRPFVSLWIVILAYLIIALLYDEIKVMVVLKWAQIYFQWSMLLVMISNTKDWWAIQSWLLFCSHILPLYLRYHQSDWNAINCPEILRRELNAIASVPSFFPSISCIIFSRKWRTGKVLSNSLKDAKESLMQKNIFCMSFDFAFSLSTDSWYAWTSFVQVSTSSLEQPRH